MIGVTADQRGKTVNTTEGRLQASTGDELRALSAWLNGSGPQPGAVKMTADAPRPTPTTPQTPPGLPGGNLVRPLGGQRCVAVAAPQTARPLGQPTGQLDLRALEQSLRGHGEVVLRQQHENYAVGRRKLTLGYSDGTQLKVVTLTKRQALAIEVRAGDTRYLVTQVRDNSGRNRTREIESRFQGGKWLPVSKTASETRERY